MLPLRRERTDETESELRRATRAAELWRRRYNCAIDKDHEKLSTIMMLETATADQKLDQLAEGQSNEDYFQYTKAPFKPDEKWKRELALIGESATRSRAYSYAWRGAEEVQHRASWYPIFGTLTLDNLNHADWHTNCTLGWHHFRKRLKHAAGYAAFGATYKTMPQTAYLTYIACVEKGELGRWHMHYLAFLKAIPDDWKRDPNLGRRVPDYREIPAAKTLWDKGFSSPIAVRSAVDDIWGKLGWRWPVDRRTGKELVSAGPMAVGSYVAKYVGKDTGEHQTWRIRMSRGFGLTRLKSLLSTCPTAWLKPLAAPWPESPQPGGRLSNAMPRSVTRRLARHERSARIWRSPKARSSLIAQIQTGRRPPTLWRLLGNMQHSANVNGGLSALLLALPAFQHGAVCSELLRPYFDAISRLCDDVHWTAEEPDQLAEALAHAANDNPPGHIHLQRWKQARAWLEHSVASWFYNRIEVAPIGVNT